MEKNYRNIYMNTNLLHWIKTEWRANHVLIKSVKTGLNTAPDGNGSRLPEFVRPKARVPASADAIKTVVVLAKLVPICRWHQNRQRSADNCLRLKEEEIQTMHQFRALIRLFR